MAAVTSKPNGKALLFDLDGTLIDSMPAHEQAWIIWHERHGVEMDATSFFASTAGRTNNEILSGMLPGRAAAEYKDWADEKEALYRAQAGKSLVLVAGARDYLVKARGLGFSLAICTAATPENMALAFRMFELDRLVDTVTSPSDGLRGKPHPDIFLEAARRLEISPEHCVVFEDAPLGVEAARRAGMTAVALTTTLPAAAFASVNPPDTFATLGRRKLVALKEFRASMPMLDTPSEELTREDRDRR
jgi:beta-phosphoglucomutase